MQACWKKVGFRSEASNDEPSNCELNDGPLAIAKSELAVDVRKVRREERSESIRYTS